MSKKNPKHEKGSNLDELNDYFSNSELEEEIDKELEDESEQTKWEELNDIDSEEEEIEKPPWKAYNSMEGSIYLNPLNRKLRKKYKHGEKLPNGQTCNAPKLSTKQFANLFEQFEYPVLVEDPVTHRKHFLYDENNKVEMQIQPARIGKLDEQFEVDCRKYKRLMYLAHRNFHKSSDLARWGKRCAADFGDTILYAGATSEESTEFTQNLRDTFLFNDKFKEWYGYIIDEKKGNKKGKVYWLAQRFLETTRYPGLKTLTPKNHRTGAHPKRIFLDDVVGEEVYEHPKLIQNINNWFKKAILPMAKGDTQIVVVGTYKDPNDLYNVIRRDRTFKVIIIRAIDLWPNGGQRTAGTGPEEVGKWYYTEDQDGIVCGVGGLQGGQVGNDEFFDENWELEGRIQYYINNDPRQGFDKNHMSMQEFLLKRKEVGSVVFETEYQLNPIAVTRGYLQYENIHNFDMGGMDVPDFGKMCENMVAMFDQSFGSKNTSDYCCCQILSGVMNSNETQMNYYLIDSFLWRGGGVNRKVAMLSAIYQKYPWIRKFGIEGGFANSQDMNQIKSDLPNIPWFPVYQNKPAGTKDPAGLEIHHVEYTFTDVPAKHQGKIKRILNQLDTPMQMGQLWIRKGIGAQVSDETEEGIEQELNPIAEFMREQSFPFCQHFDFLDSLGSGIDLIEVMDSDRDFFFYHGYV